MLNAILRDIGYASNVCSVLVYPCVAHMYHIYGGGGGGEHMFMYLCIGSINVIDSFLVYIIAYRLNVKYKKSMVFIEITN